MDAIITQSDVEFVRNSKEGIECALLDLMALSRCEKIYGSYYSSFSEVAAKWGDKTGSIGGTLIGEVMIDNTKFACKMIENKKLQNAFVVFLQLCWSGWLEGIFRICVRFWNWEMKPDIWEMRHISQDMTGMIFEQFFLIMDMDIRSY